MQHPVVNIRYSSEKGDNCFIASVIGFPNITAHGSTMAIAAENIQNAIDSYSEAIKLEKDPSKQVNFVMDFSGETKQFVFEITVEAPEFKEAKEKHSHAATLLDHLIFIPAIAHQAKNIDKEPNRYGKYLEFIDFVRNSVVFKKIIK